MVLTLEPALEAGHHEMHIPSRETRATTGVVKGLTVMLPFMAHRESRSCTQGEILNPSSCREPHSVAVGGGASLMSPAGLKVLTRKIILVEAIKRADLINHQGSTILFAPHQLPRLHPASPHLLHPQFRLPPSPWSATSASCATLPTA